jgi:hypothetical protein
VSDRFATVDVLARRVEQLAAGDPDATRVVYAIVIALLVIGLLLVLLAIWMIRRTKADPELLGPLERMGDRKWRKRDEAGRWAMLDEVRPAGATPPTWPDSADHAVGTVLPPPAVAPVLEAPDLVEPEAAEAEAVEPDAVEPDVVETESVETESVETEAVEPDVAEPDVVETESLQTETVEPDDPFEPDSEALPVPADAIDKTTAER